MKIAVYGKDDSWNELLQGNVTVEWIRVDDIQQLFAKTADAYFNLSGEAAVSNSTGKPYFINSVDKTSAEMDAGENVLRINGWTGFLAKESWEISGEINHGIQAVMVGLGKKIIEVADEPGFISARVIAMVINEAFYAEEEGVSTPAEIDIAMKLGTNYPFGPFEWAEKIGLENIYTLLKKLAEKDSRYIPASSLIKKVTL